MIRRISWMQRWQRDAGANQAVESERLAQQRLYGERRTVRRLGEDRSLQLPDPQEPAPQSSNSA